MPPPAPGRPGSPGQPRSPFLTPAPPPALPPADPAVRQRALAALALAALSLVAMAFIGNLQRGATVAGVAFAVAVVGLSLAVSARSAVRRAGAQRPRGATGGLVLGIIAALVSGVALLGFLMFGPQLTQYGNCMSATTTTAGQQACKTQLQHAIDSKIGVSSSSS